MTTPGQAVARRRLFIVVARCFSSFGRLTNRNTLSAFIGSPVRLQEIAHRGALAMFAGASTSNPN
jgi:hypothetical protein